jgi:flagellar biosynthesis/type III secretory pathway chaperone
MNKQEIEIFSLLKHKQKTCSRLLEKMKEQMKAVEIRNGSRLESIIEEKETLIADLNEIDQKIAGLARDLDQTILTSLTSGNTGLAKRIESDLEKIIEQETVCQTKLNLVKSEVLEKIKAVKSGHRLLKGYGVTQRIKPKISKNI